ncbi:MAG: hypothetical protein Q9166_001109 [cf. Caloplaca sp. 2 TL-2023]
MAHEVNLSIANCRIYGLAVSNTTLDSSKTFSLTYNLADGLCSVQIALLAPAIEAHASLLQISQAAQRVYTMCAATERHRGGLARSIGMKLISSGNNIYTGGQFDCIVGGDNRLAVVLQSAENANIQCSDQAVTDIGRCFIIMTTVFATPERELFGPSDNPRSQLFTISPDRGLTRHDPLPSRKALVSMQRACFDVQLVEVGVVFGKVIFDLVMLYIFLVHAYGCQPPVVARRRSLTEVRIPEFFGFHEFHESVNRTGAPCFYIAFMSSDNVVMVSMCMILRHWISIYRFLPLNLGGRRNNKIDRLDERLHVRTKLHADIIAAFESVIFIAAQQQ